MPAITQTVSLRLDPELVGRAKVAAGAAGLSQTAWYAWAVERALGASGPDPAQPASPSGSQAAPAPAEQPYRQHVPGPNVENVRSSAQKVHAANCKCPVCR